MNCDDLMRERNQEKPIKKTISINCSIEPIPLTNYDGSFAEEKLSFLR